MNSTTTTVQLPILGLLGVVFVTLKLLNLIQWSWIWVLAPFWGPFAVATVVFLSVFGYSYFTMMYDNYKNTKKRI
jgi:hypothetical protein